MKHRFSRFLCCAIAAVAILLCAPQAGALADERIALVIGNGNYQVARDLATPAADSRLIAETLESLGFEVALLVDADQFAMERAVAMFGQRLRAAGSDSTSLVYYAGHGVQYDGTNYLLPVNADIRDAADLYLYSVEIDGILRQLLSAPSATRIVLLDTGYGDPFETLGQFGGNGLAEMAAPENAFVGYATAPDRATPDATGPNSPFSEILAREMRVEGQPIEWMFVEVRNSVLRASEGQQTPWRSSTLASEFVFHPEGVGEAEDRVAREIWDAVKRRGDPVQVIAFLRNYPDSSVSDEARAFLTESLQSELAFRDADTALPNGVEASPTEADLFRRAQAAGTVEAYKAYLGTFPEAVFADLAYKEIAAQELWKRVQQTGDPVQIMIFLRSYPDTSVSNDARARLKRWLETEMEPQSAEAGAAPAAADRPAGSSASESDVFWRAQASGNIEDYQTYIAEFPNGVFVEIALAEIQAMQAEGATAAGGTATRQAAVAPPPGTGSAAPDSAATDTGPAASSGPPQEIRFTVPLTGRIPQVNGRSIAQIIESSPQYPPVKDLPESFWKEKECTACHHWNQERLCEQGKTYLTDVGKFALDKQHPMDGFKQVLRDWAAAGCQ